MTDESALVWFTSFTLIIWGTSILIRSTRREESRRILAMFLSPVLVLTGIGGAFAAYVLGSYGTSDPDYFPLSAFQVSAIGVLVCAMALVFLSYRGDRSRGRQRCPKCWYDMSGSPLLCPECGRPSKNPKDLLRPRRRWRGIRASLIISLIAYGLWVVPHVVEGGAPAAIPTWALIVGLPWFPDSYISSGPFLTPGPWSLRDRVATKHLRGPELWLLRQRAERLVSSGPGIVALERSLPYVNAQAFNVRRGIWLSIARALSNKDAQLSARAMFIARNFIPTDDNIGVFNPDPRFSSVIPELLVALRPSSSWDARACAAWCVAAIGTDADSAVPLIIQSLKDPYEVGSFRSALRVIARNSPPATRIILDASHDPDPDIRRGCAHALGSISAGNRGGSTRLLEMLGDPDFGVQYCAAVSLAQAELLPDQVIPAILHWAGQPDLADPEPIHLLSRFDRVPLTSHAHLLVDLLDHPNGQIRDAVLNVLTEVVRQPNADTSAITTAIELLPESGTAQQHTARELLPNLRLRKKP